jgi:hypothetical protein
MPPRRHEAPLRRGRARRHLDPGYIRHNLDLPPGKTRDSGSRAISTTRSDPSGMAMGPSGNSNPLAMILNRARRSAMTTSSETKAASLK